MSNLIVDRDVKSFVDQYEYAISSGDYIGALSSALGGYILTHSNGDRLYEKLFLSNIKIVTDKLHAELIPPSNGTQADFKTVCSFCYKAIEDRQPVYGVGVSICADCIRLASEIQSGTDHE